MTDNPVSLTIDGQPTKAAPGATILDVARQIGIDIPSLCYEPGLTPQAQCRLCIVEVEGRPRLEPACASLVTDGMVVHANSDRVLAARRMILQLLLSEHPQNCPARALGNECKLCDYADEFDLQRPAFGFGREREDVAENSFISRNPAACILCSKCVRVCDQVQGIGALAFNGRGSSTEMRPALSKILDQTDCEMCGNCVAVCPTGAMMASQVQGLADAEKVRTTCGFCGVGCQMELNVKNGRVIGVTSSGSNEVNGKWLCAKGRFGCEFIQHPERLDHPLIRRNGALEPASWDEAFGVIASGLMGIKSADGPDAIAFMSSSRCTNEENYLVQKLARAVIGTNNVDQCART